MITAIIDVSLPLVRRIYASEGCANRHSSDLRVCLDFRMSSIKHGFICESGLKWKSRYDLSQRSDEIREIAPLE